MASVEQACPWTGERASGGDAGEFGPGRQDLNWAVYGPATEPAPCATANVGGGERLISLAAGSLLGLLGLERRDGIGLMVAGLGGAMLYRGITGHCHLYDALNVSTAEEQVYASSTLAARGRAAVPAKDGIHITQCLMINQPREKLYDYWRHLENLPNFMTHLKSVRATEGNRSHWVAEAPWIVGGEVQWDAEVIADEPQGRIVWRSLPGSMVEHHGSVTFKDAPGDRGTAVRVDMKYLPPAGKLGQWISKLFGDAPEQQIHEDLRNFKRLMEVGEIPTVAGQPRGLCNH